jgi:hypothetical protein
MAGKQAGKSKTTAKTPAGGGNRYTQAAIGKGFVAIPPREGHTQRKNVKPAIKPDK